MGSRKLVGYHFNLEKNSLMRHSGRLALKPGWAFAFFCFPRLQEPKIYTNPCTDPHTKKSANGASRIFCPGHPFRVTGGRRGLAANHDRYQMALTQERRQITPPWEGVAPRLAAGSVQFRGRNLRVRNSA